MRRDGKRVKSHNVEYEVVPHIMPERNDAMNFAEINIPLAPMQHFINKRRKEGFSYSHLAVILAAYVRVIAQFPELNRFVVNRKVYARNELNVGMVVLKSGDDDNGTMSKINFLPSDTLLQVNEKITSYINENRGEEDNATDKLAGALLKVPGLLRFGVNFLRFMDRHGLLPASIIDASPFHASMSITNLASIRCAPVYHHTYNFGTTSVFIAMGKTVELPTKGENGTVLFEKHIPLKVVMDERIASGAYYSRAFRVFENYLKNPEELELPLTEDKIIIEVEYRKGKN